MKTRTGFVSNSSSSSFIVKITDQNRDKIHYNYKVVEKEYMFNEDSTRCEFKEDDSLEFVPILEWLDRKGFTLNTDNKEEDYKEYVRTINIQKANQDTGRGTCVAFGEELKEYLTQQDEYNEEDLKDVIQQYGIENIAYFRESDEGMGGDLPEELRELRKQAIKEWDYH